MPLVVANYVREKGFVTRLMGVLNQESDYLERALGFRAGRLAQGWMLLALKKEVLPDEFAFAGYTNSSGGEVVASTPSGARMRTPIEALSQAASGAADARLGTGHGLAKRNVAETFVLERSNRIIKVVPGMQHMNAISADEQYPAGIGLPQWILLAPKLFVVAALIPPSSCHLGGGAGNHPVPAQWVDPQLVKRI